MRLTIGTKRAAKICDCDEGKFVTSRTREAAAAVAVAVAVAAAPCQLSSAHEFIAQRHHKDQGRTTGFSGGGGETEGGGERGEKGEREINKVCNIDIRI